MEVPSSTDSNSNLINLVEDTKATSSSSANKTLEETPNGTRNSLLIAPPVNYSSTDIPITIPSVGSNTITSTLVIPPSATGVITDINLTNLGISHSYLDDLTITLTSPAGTEITLISGQCSYHDDLSIEFDDDGTTFFSIPCPATDGLSYQAVGILASFNGENPVGTWTLTVDDNADLDGGTLNSWGLEILTDTYLSGPCVLPGCTISHTTVGSCVNYTVNVGDTLCINEDYNCTVTINGGAVYVAPGVNFSPTISGNIAGAIINCGTVNLAGVGFVNNGSVYNYGMFNFNSNVNINGSAYFYNGEGAEMNYSANFNLDQNSTYVNDGDLTVSGEFLIRTGCTFINGYELNLTGNFTTEGGGQTTNNGRVISQGNININTSASVINNCTFNANDNIVINEDFQNNGLLYTITGVGNIAVNSASVFTNNGDVVSNTLQIDGTIEGNGFFWAIGSTMLNSGASFGLDNKGLNIYDSSTPAGSQFFDIENGIVDPSATNDPPAGLDTIPSEDEIILTCGPLLTRGMTEICNNGIDDDGDGLIDCLDPDCSFQAFINFTDETFAGNNDGTATATVDKGGATPVDYIWDTGQTTAVITNLAAGNYSVTATDDQGCTANSSIVLGAGSSTEISGTIFEDINYGGGDGRNYSSANTSAQASGWSVNEIAVDGVRVELYDNTGAFVNFTTTDINGNYSFIGLSNSTYTIRVVNSSVASNRASNATGQTIIPVQTFRTDGTTAVLNEVGGASPALIDAGANTTNANISTLTTATTDAQSVTSISISGSNVSNVDFGFNFDVIVNTNDSGQGSLRQFILNNNELANTNLDQEDNPTNGVSFPKDVEWETSIFMIPGVGPHVIQPQSVLPFVRDPQTHISAYTQAGSVQGPIATRTLNVELIGNTTTFNGLTIYTNDVQISGLAINSFSRGIYSYLNGSVNSFIWGNYVGTKVDGTTTGTNTGNGIHFQDISNSFVGTNGDNVNDANEGNLSSDSYGGVELRNTSNVWVAGNYVGTDKTGMLDLGNRYLGIHLRGATGINYVGFKDSAINNNGAELRNVSSGNGTDGVRLSSSSNQVISGNYLGTNALGTGSIRNSGYGLQLVSACSNNLIGTNANGDDDALERNLISGNLVGMRFSPNGSGTNNRVAGNYIGTDYTGNAPLPNLNNGFEINTLFINNIIGTNGDNVRDAIERNVISGNEEDGIRLSATTGNTISGNYIGLGADGITNVGNGGRGILIALEASNNIFGYSPIMANSDELIVGNKIKNNLDSGIAISGTGTQNKISRNQLANNGTLGIDLDYDLVSANDNGDGDTGPNNMLNFPVFESAVVIGSNLVVKGFAPAGSMIEFFIADGGNNPDPFPAGYTSSFGEGAVYLLSLLEGSGADTDATTGSYTDDGTGAVSTKNQNRFEITIDTTSLGLSLGQNITATATDINNNTSEFSGWTLLNYIEICNDGIDNDGDGLVDCFDCEDCFDSGDCNDNDNDGIGDFCDLDDDNDGIPDFIETTCLYSSNDVANIASPSSQSTNTTGILTSGPYTANLTINSTVSSIESGDGIKMTYREGMNATYTINTDLPIFNPTIFIDNIYHSGSGPNRVGNFVFTLSDNSIVSNPEFRVISSVPDPWTTGISSNDLVEKVYISGAIYVQDPSMGSGSNQGFGYLIFEDSFRRLITATGGVTSFTFDVVNGANYNNVVASFGVKGNLQPCVLEDFDNDGIPNYFDLDSDNDGIFDLDEAGHTEADANNDGIIDGANSLFGTNGLFDNLETAPDSDILNYNISNSETTPVGDYDPYELDSDGDGCFDALEENVADSEDDGIAGTGIPTVDANGLVTSITYADPPNNNWQNPLSGSCLTEICNDGIDNDADGLTDCDDPDCNVTAAINETAPSCPGETQSFTATDQGSGVTYTWDFGSGATPSTATGLGPHNITFNACGIDTIFLSLDRAGCVGFDTLAYSTIDNAPPVFSPGDIPNDTTINCSATIPVAPAVTATDNCGTPIVTFSESDNQGTDACNQSNYSIIRTWTATDGCGNVTTQSQIINIEDPTNTCTGSNVIGGVAFLDPDNNGAQDDVLSGVAGVRVYLYEDNAGGSVLLDQTTTGTTGSYTFTTGITNGASYRVEFVRPTGMTEEFTRHGDDNGTDVQFVTAPNCNVDVGLADPADYCDAQPYMYVSCYSFGASENNPIDAIVGLPLNLSTGPNQNGVIGGAVKHLANAEHVGSIYGMAYSSSKDMLYGAAYMKRHVGFGPGGTGAIYQIDPNATSPGASVLVDLNAVFGAGTAGVDPHPYGDTDTCPGCIGSSGTTNFNCWQYDTLSWEAVGTISLGGIDASDDGEELFVMNLADKMLYRIDIDNPTAATRYAFPEGDISCMSGGEVRPFAVEFENNKVYVGAICDQVNTSTAMLYVYELDLPTSTWRRVLEGNYQRVNGPGNVWFFSWGPFRTYLDGSYHYTNSNHPVLSDISFDNGAMSLGIRDITGDQLGNSSGRPDRACDLLWDTSDGDIFRAGYNSVTGQYEMEYDATVNGITTAGLNSGYGIAGSSGVSSYYFEDIAPNGASSISLGGIAQLPGGALYVSAYDVLGLYDFGIAAFDNQTGARAQSYQMATNTDNLSGFGKANGLGDLEFGCGEAPVEIGNRIWFDDNQNGIQDVTEQGIDGITVVLLNSNGDTVGIQITDALGEYYFSDLTVGDSTLRPNDTYYIVIGGTDYNSTTQLLRDSLELTTPNIGQAPNNDINDSDANIGTGANPLWVLDYPFIMTTTGNVGISNHDSDFGFKTCFPDVDFVLLDNDDCISNNTFALSGGTPLGGTYSGTGVTGTNFNASVAGIGAHVITYAYTNASGCTSTDSATITVLALPIATATSDGPRCSGDDLTLNETAGDGVAWSWAGPSGATSNAQSFTITNITTANAGTYSVTVTGANGCTAASTVDVVVNVLPNSTAGGNSPVCEGSNINLTETGGDAISWSWTGPNGFTSSAQNPTITNVTTAAAGVYTVVVTDANTCSSSSSVTVIVNAAPTITIGSNSPICVNETLNLTESGGDATAWSWTGPNGFSATLQNPVLTSVTTAASGNYNVTITDVNGCTSTATTSVTVNGLPTANAGSDAAICINDNTTLGASGGSNYSWSPTATLSNSNIANPVADPLVTTIYTVTVTDGNGCTDEDQVTVTVNNPMALISSNSPVCYGIDINFTSNPAVTYNWSGPNGFSSTQQSPTISSASIVNTGTYSITITDALGCTATASINVTVTACAEDCTNGIDDDGDGLIDCADCDDCSASGSCADNDGDGIGDFCDLDDDSDGIPDSLECPNIIYGPELVINGDFEDAYANWTSNFNRGINNNAATSGGCFTQGWVAVSPCATTNGTCSTYYTYNGGTFDGSVVITDPYGTGANVIPTTNCNTTANSCLAEILPDHTTGTGLSLYVDPSDIVGRAYWQQMVPVEADKQYEFSAWIMVIEEDPNLQFRIDGVNLTSGFNLDRLTGGSDGPDVWQQFFVNWYSGAATGNVLIELVNLTAGCGGNDIRLDDVSLQEIIPDCDCDGDGVDNHLDLDSDNDGIFDVDEAGHNMVDADDDGIIDGADLFSGGNGLYDALETTSDNGILNYTVADSETTPDGILDICELDSDGDGCLDAEEENVSDADLDGIAGSGVPSVDANGLVTSITYGSPPNDIWQNPLIGPCLPEICNDGIDNDFDGDADCADSDCTVTVVTSNNGPVCSGGNLALFETGGAAINWSWSGPNGFTSTNQNPTIIGVTTANAGSYSVTITNTDGCTATSSESVIINNCLADLGNFVWEDENEDGIQNVGEPGIEGVTVSLYNSANTFIANTTTAANGSYLFPSVGAGTYYLVFDVSTNVNAITAYKGTLQNIGSANLDSDPNPATGITPLFLFNTAFGDILTLDAGFIISCPASQNGGVEVIRK